MAQRTGHRTKGIDQMLLWILGGVLAVILVLLPIHAFVSTWGGTAVGPLLVWKSWKEVLIALAVPLVVWLCVLRPDITRAMWRSRLNHLIVAYVVVTLALSLVSAASVDAVIAGFLMNLRFFALFVLAQVLVVSGAQWVSRAKQWLTGWLIGTGALLSVLAILQVTVVPRDFLAQFGYNKDTTISPYLLVDQDPNALRAFATMRGPNTLGAYLLLPLALALVVWWQRRQWWLLSAAGLMVVGLALTGSRSAWLGAAAMVAVLAYATLPRQKLLKWVKFGTVPALLLSALVLWLATTVPPLRLAVFHSGGDDPGEALTEGSSDQHWQAALNGLSDITQAPLGLGVGTAGPASFYNTAQAPRVAENYFIQIGQEVGVIGLALFCVVCVGVAYALWRQKQPWPRALLASFVGIAIINLFLHGWADDPTAMTWWALAGLFITRQK